MRTIALVIPLLFFGSAFAAELFDETKAATIFAFDTHSIPHSQNLRLEMQQPRRHAANPVVRRGAPGSADALGVQFYGSVLRENGKLRMWYVAFDDDAANKVASARWRPAYAESSDGVAWTKPALGLVEHRGSRDNNLVEIDPALGVVNLKVLRDDDDPDPQRRYKMTAHVYFRGQRRLGTLAPFASADGLRWKMLVPAVVKNAELTKDALVLPAIHFEPSGGLYRWDGFFYACGQNALNATRPYQGRVTRMFRSRDFVEWSATSSVGFIRTPQHGTLGAGRSLEGEQTHEGIGVWNRRNVLLGLVGQWHGAAEWKDVRVDLGFVVSNDGVNFREPAHEWTFLRRGEDGAWDEGGVLQGQGFENVGEQTCIYYGAWDPRDRAPGSPRGGVGIATLPRDRFGALVVETAGEGQGDYQLPRVTSEFVTSDIEAGKTARFFLNADGLGDDATLKVELLDHLERPLGCTAVVRESGFQVPLVFDGTRDLPERVRLRVVFEGAKRTGIRFHAIYVQ